MPGSHLDSSANGSGVWRGLVRSRQRSSSSSSTGEQVGEVPFISPPLSFSRLPSPASTATQKPKKKGTSNKPSSPWDVGKFAASKCSAKGPQPAATKTSKTTTKRSCVRGTIPGLVLNHCKRSTAEMRATHLLTFPCYWSTVVDCLVCSSFRWSSDMQAQASAAAVFATRIFPQ